MKTHGYVILNLENKTYDGKYFGRELAFEILQYCKEEWSLKENGSCNPEKIVLCEYDGVASDLEPEYKWMADAFAARRNS